MRLTLVGWFGFLGAQTVSAHRQRVWENRLILIAVIMHGSSADDDERTFNEWFRASQGGRNNALRLDCRNDLYSTVAAGDQRGDPKVELRTAPGLGRGVYALKDIAEGEPSVAHLPSNITP